MIAFIRVPSPPAVSEYQYYEFQAIDRRLSPTEMAKLRSVSTRARITPTSFVNEYEWGDFQGDEDAWMEKYFDAFLYFANWGTHTLIATKQPASYDRAVTLLVDLRDATAVHGRESDFRRRLDALWTEHERKPSLIAKLRRAGLSRRL